MVLGNCGLQRRPVEVKGENTEWKGREAQRQQTKQILKAQESSPCFPQISHVLLLGSQKSAKSF